MAPAKPILKGIIMKILKLAVAALAFIAGIAFAAERATTGEAKTMADAAVAHVAKVGWDKAKTDFNDKGNADWHKKDLYVFAFDPKGVVQAHGVNEKLIGKDLSGIKDTNGREWVKEMAAMAANGGKSQGWVEYTWQHPETKKVEDKVSYMRKVSGAELVIGVGAYK